MKTKTKAALATIRAKLSLRRLSARRLFRVNDGAYTWIGDRADLTAVDARDLRAIHVCGSRPEIADKATWARHKAADYDSICGRVPCIAATHGAAGIVRYEDLPADWQDRSALGPIEPL